jgi:hypothetical protein
LLIRFDPIFPLTTIMAHPHQTITSSDDEAEAAPAPAPPKAKTRRTGDDLSGNQTFPNRTRDAAQRQPSEKQHRNGM